MYLQTTEIVIEILAGDGIEPSCGTAHFGLHPGSENRGYPESYPADYLVVSEPNRRPEV